MEACAARFPELRLQGQVVVLEPCSLVPLAIARAGLPRKGCLEKSGVARGLLYGVEFNGSQVKVENCWNCAVNILILENSYCV